MPHRTASHWRTTNSLALRLPEATLQSQRHNQKRRGCDAYRSIASPVWGVDAGHEPGNACLGVGGLTAHAQDAPATYRRVGLAQDAPSREGGWRP